MHITDAYKHTRRRVIIRASATIGNLDIKKIEEELKVVEKSDFSPNNKDNWQIKRTIWSVSISMLTIVSIVNYVFGGDII